MTRIENFIILILVNLLVAFVCVRKKIASDAEIVASSMFGVGLCYYCSFKGVYIDYGTTIMTLLLGSFICITLGRGLGCLVDEHVHIDSQKRDIWYWIYLIFLNLICLILVFVLLAFSL